MSPSDPGTGLSNVLEAMIESMFTASTPAPDAMFEAGNVASVEDRSRPIPTLTADEAGAEVQRLLGGWFGSLAGKAEPSEAMLTASLGVGKTHRLAVALEAWAALNPTRRALVRVPDHALAADLRAMIEARAPDISGVHLGLERADPNAEGALMCRRVADVVTARRAGGSTSTICGSAKRGLCPHHPDNPRVEKPCGYLTQDNRDAQIVLVAGDVSLDHAPPRGIRRRGGLDKMSGQRHFDVLVVDETSPASMFKGGEAALELFDADRLADLAIEAGAEVYGKNAVIKFNDLADLRAGLIHVRAGLEAEPLRSFNFNRDLVAAAYALVWLLRVDISAAAAGRSGRSLEAALAKPGKVNRAVRNVAGVLRALLQCLDDGLEGVPHVQVVNGDGGKGGPVRTVSYQARQRIAPAYGGPIEGAKAEEEDDGLEEWLQSMSGKPLDLVKLASASTPDPVHVLILDATGSPEPLLKWWPGLELLGDVRAKDAPNVVRCQLLDSAMSYAKCVPKPKRGEAANRRAAEEARVIRVIAELRRIQSGGRSGFIGPKELIHTEREDGELVQKGSLAENGLGFGPETAIGWFGNIRGSNAMTGVSSLVVASRPAAETGKLERIAAVLFGCDVTPEEPGTNGGGRPAGTRDRTVTMRDGSTRRIPVARYRDERSEAVRRMISDHEVAQAEGRARSIRWIGPGKLLIDVLTNCADVGPIDHLISWDEYCAAGGWIGELLLRGVWVTGNGRSELLAAALRAEIENPPFSYKISDGIGGVSILDPRRWLESELRPDRAEGLARKRLSDEINAAFDADRDPIVLHAPFPARGWHRVSAQSPGSRLRPTAHLRADTPEATLERAREIWPGAALILIPKGETP